MSSTNPSIDHSLDATLDATLDALSHSTRRYLLWYLTRESGRVSVETLAAAVAAWRTGDGESELDPDARRRAHVSLRHVHLPRLESAGLVERARESGATESEPETSESGESGAEYVEATTDDTPVEVFLDADLLGEFAESDRP